MITTIKTLYNANIPTITSNKLIAEAIEILDGSKSSSIVAIDEQRKPLGILTERDIAKQAGHWDEINQMPVNKVMSTPVITIDEQHEFRDAYIRMSEKGFRHLVVTKKDGTLAGILDEGNFLTHLTPEQLLAIKEVKLVMSKNVLHVKPDDSVSYTIKLMTDKRISSMIVVSDNKPVGIFTERDSIHLARKGDCVLNAHISEYMTSPLKTINQNSSVMDAEYILRTKHIRHLVAVDDEGNLVGVISQHDLVKGISGIYIEMLRDTIRKQSDIIMDAFNRIENTSIINNLLNSFPNRILITCDLDYTIRLLNKTDIDYLIIPSKGQKIDENVPYFDTKISDTILDGNTTTTIQKETMIRDLNGKKRYFKTSYAPIFSDEKVLQGIFFMVEDITEKKEEELKLHQFKHIVSATTDLIILIDKNYTFIAVNDAYLKYHHKTREEVIGFSVETLIGQENFYAQKDSLDKALSGEEFTIKNNDFYDENNNRRSEEIRFYPYKDENDNTEAVVLNIRDITESQKIEVKLKEQEEMMIIQSRQAAMGEMISMIAHQWRQPLSVIAMSVNNVLVDIDLGEFKEEELINHSHTILNQTEYLSNTIDDFRNFFKRSKEVEEDKIAHIIESALQIIKPSLDANNIQIDVNCDSNIKLSTYKSELKQVIINILSNARDALKAIQSNTKQIKISVTEEEDKVLFSFFNNGPEIKPRLIHKIFEPYFTTKESLGGSGLGLYMSKSIMVKHLHGKISAKNRDGGVEFNILIPKILEDEQN